MKVLLTVSLALLAGPTPVADFRDMAATAGLTATFQNGGTLTKQFILEPPGAGPHSSISITTASLTFYWCPAWAVSNRLYHNEGDGRFSDVTSSRRA